MLNFNLLKKHQSFSTKQEMDEAVRAFLSVHKPELSNGNIKVLKHIWRHSVKVVGVSFCRIDTIIKATSLSKSTVVRSINKFEEYGLIKRIPTLKPNKKRGVNILVLQHIEGYTLPSDDTPYETDNDTLNNSENPCHEGSEAHKSISETENKQRISKSIKDSNNVEGYLQLDHTYCPSYIPKEYVESTKNHLNAFEVDGLWKRIQIAYNKSNLSFDINYYLDIIINTFKQCIFAMKRKAIKGSFFGYYYGAISKQFHSQSRKERNRGLMNWDYLSESGA